MAERGGNPASTPWSVHLPCCGWGSWHEGLVETHLSPLVYPGMMQMSGYQPAMIPAPMPVMPAMGTVPAIPGRAELGSPGSLLKGAAVSSETRRGIHGHRALRASSVALVLICSGPPVILTAMMLPSQSQPLLPSLDTRELAVQQQNFINQQALLLVRGAGPQGSPRGGEGRSVAHSQPELLPGPLPIPLRPSR